jgi:hypothetical protein
MKSLYTRNGNDANLTLHETVIQSGTTQKVNVTNNSLHNMTCSGLNSISGKDKENTIKLFNATAGVCQFHTNLQTLIMFSFL